MVWFLYGKDLGHEREELKFETGKTHGQDSSKP